MSKLQVVTLTCTSVCVFVVLPTHGTNIYLALGIEEFENEPKDCILKLFTFWSLGGRISHKTTYGCGNSCLSALLPFLLLAAFDGHIGHWTIHGCGGSENKDIWRCGNAQTCVLRATSEPSENSEHSGQEWIFQHC